MGNFLDKTLLQDEYMGLCQLIRHISGHIFSVRVKYIWMNSVLTDVILIMVMICFL